MDKTEKSALYQEFLKMVEYRNELKLTGNLEAFIDYAEYCIKSEVSKQDTKRIKHKKKKDVFQQRFLEAYNAQSLAQKLNQYIRYIKYLRDIKEGKQQPEVMKGERKFNDAYCLSYNLHLWKKKELRLNMTKGQMYCEKDHKVKFYDLNNYLIRQSKNTDYHCFVMEAINNLPHNKSLTVRLGFKDVNTFKECFKLVKDTIIQMQRNRIRESLGIEIPTKSPVKQNKQTQQVAITISPSSSLKQQQLVQIKAQEKEKQEEKQEKEIGSLNSNSQIEDPSVIECNTFRSEIREPQKVQSDDSDKQIQTIALTLLACDSNEQMYAIQEKESEEQSGKKKNLDVFHQIVPDYDVQSLTDDTGFQLIHSQQNGSIYHHREENQRYKIMIKVEESNPVLLFQTLTRVENYTKWNTSIEEVLIKSILKSQNVAVIYQKHKALSKIYRARDFVFMRHVFKVNDNLYFLDKSIENASYPPFITIVRGDLQIIWGIIKQGSGHIIAADIEIQNEGYINDSQNHNLTMLYIKGLLKIKQYLKDSDNVLVQLEIFDLDWDITRKATNKKKHVKDRLMESGDKTFKKLKKAESIEEHQSPQKLVTKRKEEVSPQKIEQSPPVQKPKPLNLQIQVENVKMNNQTIQEEQVGQVVESPRAVNIEFKYEFDKNGLVLIPQNYLKAKYRFSPEPSKPIVYQKAVEGHPIWKGEWRVDSKNGGIIFINQHKINDQKGVIKFILSKIAKNLLSGKSILNISLPVDIFGYESNLERLSFGMTYAPIMLEKAVAETSAIERLKIVTGFGLTNSALYLSMQKPFNSILGETFQGWINGCPIYMEQISHHPPIAAFMLLGRGYKMTGCLESKVELHMNSGCGTNDGIYRIVMDDGSDFNFITPGGEISGISYGDRKFNLVGKYYVWSKKHNLFLDLVMDPCSKKGFLAKREHPTDFMEGYLKQVTPKFLAQFEKLSQKDRESPSKQDIVKVICKADGTWHKYLMFEDKQFLNLDKEFGCELEYDNYMLPSDGNYRQDLAYRRRKDIVRAQTQKERLQNLQRGDRKLREKFHGSKH